VTSTIAAGVVGFVIIGTSKPPAHQYACRWGGKALRQSIAFAVACCLVAGSACACPNAQTLHALSNEAGIAGAKPLGQWTETWQRYLEALQRCGDAPALLSALAIQSTQALDRSERDLALAIESERLTLATASGLKFNQAEAAERVGVLLADRGERDLSVLRLKEASAGFAALSEWARAADVESRLSREHRQAGDYFAALAHEQTALAHRRRIEPAPSLWRSNLNIAVLYEQLEIFDEARRRYAEALDQAEKEGDEASVAIVLGAFAGYLSDFGKSDAPQALSMAERALTIVTRNGGVPQRASARLQVGRALMNLERYADADRALTAAYADARANQHEALMAHIQFRRGELARLQGDPALALARLDDARQSYERQGNRHRLAKVFRVLQQLHQDRGDTLAAAEAGLQHYRLRDELLGTQAVGRMREVLNQFELQEERMRSAELAREKELAQLNLLAEKRRLLLSYLIAGGVLLALLLLIWRYYTAYRLSRLLREQNAKVNAQAAQLGEAYEKLREQSSQLLEASRTDALTGLRNRAQAMARLGERLALPLDFAMLLVDVDHFKQINDRLGHPVGDQVLASLGALMRSELPDSAEAFRIGGEEFMVLLPAHEARLRAEQLRQSVRAQPFRIAGRDVDLSISIGGVFADDLAQRTPECAYATADAALYEAKHAGRDCLRWSSVEPAAVLH
jgi:diguanylate cyclase (GGDEF)-like protein